MVPTNPFILFLGGAELLQLATRQSEHLTSSQTVLATLSKNRMGFVCDFDGDGFSLILPLSTIKLIPRQRRNGTVEKSNGGPLVFRPLCEDRPNVVRQLYFFKNAVRSAIRSTLLMAGRLAAASEGRTSYIA